jgi:membrane-associated phospholipid phosphatase
MDFSPIFAKKLTYNLRTSRYFSYCCLTLLIPMLASAQTDSSRVNSDSLQLSRTDTTHAPTDSIIRYRINRTYLKSIFEDLGYTVSRPAHWHKKDFTRLGVVFGVTGGLMLADYEIKRAFQLNQTKFLNSVAQEIEPFGNAYSPYLILGMYAVGVVTKNRNLEHASLMTTKSLLISTLLYTTAKVIIRRERPSFTDNTANYDPPFTGDRKHTSFPSGHMLTVTTVATALAEIYGEDYPWVPWVTYSLAGLTGVSRLYHNRHWSSDVWIGASLGYFVTKTVFKHQRQRSKRGTYNPLAVP